MNNVRCMDCIHYDPRFKFTPRGEREAFYGWCKVKSIYPHTAPDGVVIPPDVRRAEPDEPIAKPFIVEGKKVVTHCTDIVRK